MKKLYNKIEQKILPYPRNDEAPVVNLADHLVAVDYIRQDRPNFDSSTQKVELQGNFDEAAKTYTEVWVTTDLSQEEIDERTPAHFVTSGGIKIGVNDTDQNAFSRMNSLIDLAGMATTDNITIKDIFGTAHVITVADFKNEMVAYGNYCYSLFLS